MADVQVAVRALYIMRLVYLDHILCASSPYSILMTCLHVLDSPFSSIMAIFLLVVSFRITHGLAGQCLYEREVEFRAVNEEKLGRRMRAQHGLQELNIQHH